ncbi:uncharacterized protein DS421_3g67710 [Arachis hypogaea]|nr:uncharacterized protein DS421_3g67710 [Arachis hypogaea]
MINQQTIISENPINQVLNACTLNQQADAEEMANQCLPINTEKAEVGEEERERWKTRHRRIAEHREGEVGNYRDAVGLWGCSAQNCRCGGFYGSLSVFREERRGDGFTVYAYGEDNMKGEQRRRQRTRHRRTHRRGARRYATRWGCGGGGMRWRRDAEAMAMAVGFTYGCGFWNLERGN